MYRNRLRKGSALSITLLLAVCVGSVVTSFLGRTLVEQNRVSQRASQVRAFRQSLGELELAKAIVSASTFTNGRNDVIQQALDADPPVVPGTGVLVEAAGPGNWYRLAAAGQHGRELGASFTYMRDGAPYVVYNYYVEEQSLGISGRPRGRIHSNHQVEFFYASGFYDDFVSAGDGFHFRNGATAENTVFAGGTDDASDPKDLLDLIDYAVLEGDADVVTPVALEAVVTFKKKDVTIDLWTKQSIVKVAVTKIKKVQVGQEWKQVTQTAYKKEYQWVDVKKSRKVWVPADNSQSSGGTDLGTVSTSGGYWKTEYYYVKEYKLVNVPNGTEKVWKWVPIYENKKVTEYVDQLVPGTLQSSTTYAADGKVFYFKDNIKSLAGELDGRTTLVTEAGVKIVDSLQYVDANGEPAMLHGETNSKTYEANPKFIRNHALGIIAKGDILYSLSCPNHIEINASLISTHGTVAFEGIVVGADGSLTLSASATKRECLRRFGSVMSSKRPCATLLGVDGMLLHGFKTGDSTYDRSLVFNSPPGYPSEQVVMWQPNMKASGADWTDAGRGSYDANVITPLAGLRSMSEVRELVKETAFDWGDDDRRDCDLVSRDGVIEIDVDDASRTD